jgi:hypothetical protein
MAKLPWLKILFIGLQIARDVVAALSDSQTPGHITEDEFKAIVTRAIEYALSK